MQQRLLVALVLLALIIAIPALIVGFVAGALVQGAVVAFNMGRAAISPPVSLPKHIEEEDD